MSDSVQQFGNISLGSRSGTVCLLERQPVGLIALIFTLFRADQSQGQLKITPAGFFWKKTGAGAGKTVELPIKGVLGLHKLACSIQQLFCAKSAIQCANVSNLPCNVPMLHCNADIDKFIWTKVARGCQLGVKGKSGATTNFTGFRDQVQTSTTMLQRSLSLWLHGA